MRLPSRDGLLLSSAVANGQPRRKTTTSRPGIEPWTGTVTRLPQSQRMPVETRRQVKPDCSGVQRNPHAFHRSSSFTRTVRVRCYLLDTAKRLGRGERT